MLTNSPFVSPRDLDEGGFSCSVTVCAKVDKEVEYDVQMGDHTVISRVNR